MTRLIDADALKEEYLKLGHCAETYEELYASTEKLIDNAPTVKPCDNCDLYFIAKTKEEMRKGGTTNDSQDK